MSLRCGIVGLPNVGKSTLFKALTGIEVSIENFPYTTTESNLGIVQVPDERLFSLAEIENPQKITPNTVEFIDIAGLAKGASQGEGLGNKFLDAIRHCEALIHIIRCFDDENVVHINNSIDPIRDKEEVEFELQLKDLETVEKSILKAEKGAKSNDKNAKKLLELLLRIKVHLESGKAVRELSFTDEEFKWIKSFSFLTNKKILFIANVGDNDVIAGNKYTEQLNEVINEENSELLILSAKLEAEIIEIEEDDERLDFLKMYDLEEPVANRLIKSAYLLLDLITFFTIGPKEVRAWPLRRGLKAPQAAGVIHTDFERGFIRAEMIKYQDFIDLGSEQACKDKAKLSVVGKEYIAEDGDLLHFRFNV